MSNATRFSSGIACCRRGPGGAIEVLLVSKRYTYAFFEFVNGKYNPHDDGALSAMFSAMTLDEKIDILSFNFQQLWYHVWLSGGDGPRKATFAMLRARFNDSFAADGGARLRRLIQHTDSRERIWEIPKGKKKFAEEYPIDCAIREFYEETGVPKSAYRLMGGTFRQVIRENGRVYDTTYFIAFTTRSIKPKVSLNNNQQICEVYNVRWVPLSQVDMYDEPDGRLRTAMTRVVHYVRRARSASAPKEHSGSLQARTECRASAVRCSTAPPKDESQVCRPISVP